MWNCNAWRLHPQYPLFLRGNGGVSFDNDLGVLYGNEMIKYKYSKWIVLILTSALLMLLARYCKQQQDKKQASERAEMHEQIINRNKDNSTIEAQYRAKVDSVEKAYIDSLAYQKALTKAAEDQDTVIVNRYIKVPTLDNGKAVIASKDKVISGLKKESKTKDGVISEKDKKLESYDNEVQQHKLTINELDKEFQKMNGQLAKAKKPKRWGVGIQAGYGVQADNLKPAPYVGAGISYNIVRW